MNQEEKEFERLIQQHYNQTDQSLQLGSLNLPNSPKHLLTLSLCLTLPQSLCPLSIPLDSLLYLYLRPNPADNNITKKSIEWLCRTRWDNLKGFDLNCNLLGNQGVRLLGKVRGVKLETVEICIVVFFYVLAGNLVGLGGLEGLVLGDWPNLNDIYLCHNHIPNRLITPSISTSNWHKIQSIYTETYTLLDYPYNPSQ